MTPAGGPLRVEPGPNGVCVGALGKVSPREMPDARRPRNHPKVNRN